MFYVECDIVESSPSRSIQFAIAINDNFIFQLRDGCGH